MQFVRKWHIATLPRVLNAVAFGILADIVATTPQARRPSRCSTDPANGLKLTDEVWSRLNRGSGQGD